jgi:hypothetical protein
MTDMPIASVEIEWIAWAVSDPRHRQLAGAHSLGFDDLVSEVQATIHGDLERWAAVPPEARNRYSLSQQYSFDAATLADRLRALDPAQRSCLLDEVIAEQRKLLDENES